MRLYKGSISGMLRLLSQSKSNFELNGMTSHMKNSQKVFNKDILDPLTAEMSQYINIKVE